MDHVIDVTPTDGMPAIQQRLAQAGAERVVLALSDGAHQLANEVRLDLLQRQASRQSVQLALATRHLATQEAARRLGLPVFNTVAQAQGASAWPTLTVAPAVVEREPGVTRLNRRTQRWLDRARRPRTARSRNRDIQAISARPVNQRWLSAAGLLLLLAVTSTIVIGSILLLVPAGTITIVPSQQPVLASVTVRASPATEEVNVTNNLVPARQIEVLVEETAQIPTTGKRDVPDKAAVGTITLVNQRNQDLLVPAGTIVRTSTGSNVRFKTLSDVTVGPRGSAQTRIEAVDPGPAGNVPAGRINRIDGLGVALRVLNEAPTGGGTVRQGSTVTAADKERLRVSLLAQLQQRAYTRLGEQLEEGEFVPPESVETLVMSMVYDSFTDEARDTVGLTMRLLARAIAVDDRGGEELALRALQEQMPPNSRLLADSLKYNTSTFTVQEENQQKVVDFSVSASGTVVEDVDSGRIRAAVVGLTPAEAQAYVQRVWNLQQPPEVSVTPDWLGRLPVIPFRVKVHVDYDRAVAGSEAPASATAP